MRRLSLLFSSVLLIIAMAVPVSANALIHEIIGAACRSGGEEVVPPGQVRDGQSLVRALQATGVIESFDFSVAGQVTVNFDLDRPNSKYVSAGFDLFIPDGFGPGVDLILSPLPVPDPEFAAHANCRNLGG
ncbi:MAG: hypothetical protein AABZ33_01420 [Chloroflexota bacterium]